MAELGLMESLYETRIAAAERLLANFIVFHQAVKPVSQIWGLSFDLDRSESRLRVASTPAPVPFVEKLGSKNSTSNEGGALIMKQVDPLSLDVPSSPRRS